MVHLLVINPNTSPQVSGVIDALVKEEAGGAATVRTVTARFGFHYLSSRSAVAIAGHAVLDAAADAITGEDNPDAILLACFGDPALEAIKEMTGLPSVGFAEAGLYAAAAEEGRFLVATRGQVWCDMLGELIRQLGLESRVAGLHAIDDEEEDVGVIAATLARVAGEKGAARLVVGGAGLIPILPGIIRACPLPVLDPHRIAVRKAIRLAQEARAATAVRSPGMTKGLSEPLRKVFSDPGMLTPFSGNAH